MLQFSLPSSQHAEVSEAHALRSVRLSICLCYESIVIISKKGYLSQALQPVVQDMCEECRLFLSLYFANLHLIEQTKRLFVVFQDAGRCIF